MIAGGIRLGKFYGRLVLIGALLLMHHGVFSQQVMWERFWGQNRGEVFLRVLALRDGSFVASGNYPLATPTVRVYPGIFLKFTATGTPVWTRAGRTVTTGQHELVEAPGGGMVYVAGTPNLGQSWDYADPLFQRLRPNGDTLPARVYRNALDGDFATQVQPQPGGGWAIGSFSARRGSQAYSLRYVDSTGTLLGAERRYAPSLNTFGTLLAPGAAPGELLLAGSSSTGGVPPLTVHPLLIHVAATGDSLRARQYVVHDAQGQEEINNTFNNLVPTADGGYAFTALVDSAGYKLGALVKLDPQLNRQWTYLVRSRIPYSAAHRGIQVKTVREAADGSLVLVAAAFVASSANSRFDLIRVSPTGRLIRRLVVVSVCSEPVPYDLRLLPDSSAIVVGYCGSNAYLARIGGVAAPLAVPPPIQAAPAIALYPNPAHHLVDLHYEGVPPRAPRLVAVNVLGQRFALPLQERSRTPTAAHYQAACSALPAGVYRVAFWDASRLLGAGRLVVY